jgi:hypothetical protein
MGNLETVRLQYLSLSPSRFIRPWEHKNLRVVALSRCYLSFRRLTQSLGQRWEALEPNGE